MDTASSRVKRQIILCSAELRILSEVLVVELLVHFDLVLDGRKQVLDHHRLISLMLILNAHFSFLILEFSFVLLAQRGKLIESDIDELPDLGNFPLPTI